MNELNYTALKHISNFEFVDTSVQVFTACEFLIYGDVVCKPGQFGLECEHTCRCAKRSDFCFLQTGYCVFGCPAGFKGVGCLTPCIPPYYGHDCSRICSSNCENLICDSVDGKCKRCVPGRFGDYCETAQLECSSNCAYKKCRSDNFTCISCIKGRHGEYCEKECTNNTFGENCSQKCSKGCHLGAVKSSQVCDPVSGECVAAAIQTADILQRQGIVETLLTVLLICLAIPMCLTFGGVIYRKSKKIAHSRPSIIAENKGRGENLTAIPIDSFNTYMKEHTVEFLEKQFKSIPENETASKQTGLGKENVTKNVRRSITAFDHSRVYLIPNQEKNHGDYINACFVNVQGNEEIIASQGPNTWTIVDFLRMLRERNVGKVVMLNNVNEKDVVQYWSDNEITFECMKVKVLDTQVYTDYTIRQMELTKEDLPPWSLTQYHYTSWPQEGYPPCIWSLVNFENRVFLESIKYHTVVHCRTGAGRTAMFIALHELVKQAKATKKVDLVTTVRKLREDRPRMIEKLDQFIYLHEATQVALACVDTFIKLEDIFLKVFQLDHPKPGQETFESEFNKISYVTSVLQGEYGEENSAEKNKSKNRCHDILPKERYRPLLQIDEEDEDDYINAIFVPDFNKLSQQILTQLPLPTTVTDFWRLVIQHNVTLIVAFESDLKDKDATIGDYIPEDYDSPLQCGNINVSLQNLITQTDWEEKSLVVSNKSTNHQVTHLKYTANINDVVVRIFLPFILHARSKRTEEGAVIYTCRDGAKYSGLACVLTVLVDRLERDHMMTVPLAVGRVKSIRQQVISTVQQYMTVYQGIKTFSDSMNRTAAS
ncbi:receptor-type tyrosine-protein phosphatase mu-like [Physella acuta]|uniref:receptor-type tyrosine-protein phosphatase mu-like n=1 Tax=Physella acuta TaxID=109671 RepID=UPI0027DBB950|nr:receptor-type tyrosine-protein phosphatase mu-like [Physella acuta]